VGLFHWSGSPVTNLGLMRWTNQTNQSQNLRWLVVAAANLKM